MLWIHVYCKQKPVPQLCSWDCLLQFSNKANKVPFTKVLPSATVSEILPCLQLLFVGFSFAWFLCNSAQTFFGTILLMQLYREYSLSQGVVLPLLPLWELRACPPGASQLGWTLPTSYRPCDLGRTEIVSIALIAQFARLLVTSVFTLTEACESNLPVFASAP